jgi:hypothetical protein
MSTKKKTDCDKAIHNKQKIEGYHTAFGVMNRSKQRNSYVYTGAWCTQLNQENDLRRDYSLFKVRLRTQTRKVSFELFGELINDNFTIMLIEFPEQLDYMKKLSDVFVNFEWALFFKEEIDIKSQEMIDKHKQFLTQMIEFINQDSLFEFNPIQGRKRK